MLVKHIINKSYLGQLRSAHVSAHGGLSPEGTAAVGDLVCVTSTADQLLLISVALRRQRPSTAIYCVIYCAYTARIRNINVKGSTLS